VHLDATTPVLCASASPTCSDPSVFPLAKEAFHVRPALNQTVAVSLIEEQDRSGFSEPKAL